MNQSEFLKKYNISQDDFKSTGLEWEKLEEILRDYLATKHIYEPAAKEISERLIHLKKVHSIRYRIKDPEHLIEKIIRKKLESPGRIFTIENYKKEIKDILGVRAIHLYKSDWEEIGDFIENTWTLIEKPTANIREGDSEEIQNIYRGKGYEINKHKYGYRSIHYIIETNPTKTTFISELQVRTIFEEGWSEIDHNIRYPYDLENSILKGYLNIFNRLAGNADEMGTYIKFLQKELTTISENHKNSIKERDEIINDLKSKVEKLKGDNSLKKQINIDIDKLSKSQNSFTTIKGTTGIQGTVINPSYGGSIGAVYLDPTVSLLTTNGITSLNRATLYLRKCSQCGAQESDPLNINGSLSVFGNQYHTCPSCGRYLCNNCWPHSNPMNTVVQSSMLLGSARADTCPKCVEDGK
jgi:ppGpp synthetase/RelA/SpoT-type nucleotidyltranferase